MPARRFHITGKVQGVGFRWWTRGRAQELGVAGTVKNLADGSVEVIAQGTDESLDLLRDALRRGPPGANVENVEFSDADDAPRRSFEISP